MTLKTNITASLDRLEQDEWRNTIATWLGVAYSSLSTQAQTELNRIVNEAIEYISQRAAHQPWGQREETVSLASGTDQVFSLSAAVRRPIVMQEERSGGEIYPVTLSSKVDWSQAHNDTDTHPWETLTRPIYFFDGMDDAEPPAQQWRRIGITVSGATLRVIYVPYFNLVASTGSADAFVDIPAADTMAIRAEARAQWALYNGDTEKYQLLRVEREDKIAALETADRDVVEGPHDQGCDSAFLRQLG